MRMLITITSFALVSGACLVYAQGQWDSPTEVGKIGSYACPSHPQIQATWPAQCPMCRQVLKEAQPSATGTLGAALIAKGDRGSDEAEESWIEESGEQEYFPLSLVGVEYGYSYPDQGSRWGEYYSPKWPFGYPYNRYNDYEGRPYYNPGYGQYNPRTGYYFNPNTGYHYNPDTRDGYYAQDYNPSYTYPYYNYNYDRPAYGYRYPNEGPRGRATR